MKASAIIRIIVFSLVFFMLLGILVAGLCVDLFYSRLSSGEEETTTREVSPDQLHNLEIDWAAGTVKIMIGSSDKIIIKETKDSINPYTMTTEFDENTLNISYGKKSGFHLGANSSKDLLIMVPRDWKCNELEINGAALKVNIEELTIDSLELNGAATELTFNGELWELECSGAGTKLNVTSSYFINNISIDGAGCEVNLNIPEDCGFKLEAEGLGIDFDSDFEFTKNGNTYTRGNEKCKIDVSGLGCKVSVNPS